MKNPKVIAEFINGHFQVKLENWNGISAVRIEELTYTIHKAAHIEQARKLNEMRKQEAFEMAEGNRGTGTGITTDNNLLKELENVLQKS